ncbi:Eco57I restriction-modification methylase domain-containing protein, partial [bacterium]|nr:Eco57I restriction-modification methylase domain-containing protein [bacterium]
MLIKEFEKEQNKLLKDKEIRNAWLEYQSRFPHMSLFFRGASQYKNQISVINGKKAGTDINLYKLFLEQCFNLLCNHGHLGIVLPSGIYTDLGTKQLREMLFQATTITGLFGFENRKEIFEGVHRSYKFVVLTFEKAGTTTMFPATFMRHEVEELDRFPQQGAFRLSTELIRRLSPDSLSIMEFKNPIDIRIAEKMLQWPLLGEKIEGKWNLVLSQEFHMTNDSYLFKTSPGSERLPLYEGKMIHQFDHRYSEPRYWVDEKAARTALSIPPNVPSYVSYRLGFRSTGENTNVRNFISTILPKKCFAGNSLILCDAPNKQYPILVYVCALLNSYVVDYALRLKIARNINMFYVYQLPILRLNIGNKVFDAITIRATKLMCITAEFDDLAKEIGIGNHKNGVKNPHERTKLRAELDGIIAHLYGLTEDEFEHILETFP